MLFATSCYVDTQEIHVYTDPTEPIQGRNITFVCEAQNISFGNVSWYGPTDETELTNDCDIVNSEYDPLFLTCDEDSYDGFRQYNLTLEIDKALHDGLWRCADPENQTQDDVLIDATGRVEV